MPEYKPPKAPKRELRKPTEWIPAKRPTTRSTLQDLAKRSTENIGKLANAVLSLEAARVGVRTPNVRPMIGNSLICERGLPVHVSGIVLNKDGKILVNLHPGNTINLDTGISKELRKKIIVTNVPGGKLITVNLGREQVEVLLRQNGFTTRISAPNLLLINLLLGLVRGSQITSEQWTQYWSTHL